MDMMMVMTENMMTRVMRAMMTTTATSRKVSRNIMNMDMATMTKTTTITKRTGFHLDQTSKLQHQDLLEGDTEITPMVDIKGAPDHVTFIQRQPYLLNNL